jgi:hypothetical protein
MSVEKSWFQKLDLCSSLYEGRGHILSRVLQKELTLIIGPVVSKRPNRAGVSFFSPEDGNRSNFRCLLFHSYL